MGTEAQTEDTIMHATHVEPELQRGIEPLRVTLALGALALGLLVLLL